MEAKVSWWFNVLIALTVVLMILPGGASAVQPSSTPDADPAVPTTAEGDTSAVTETPVPARAGQQPPPPVGEVTSASDADLTKIAPDLRDLAKSRSEEKTLVTVLMQAGTKWQPYLENAVPRKPLGGLQWVTGEVKGADLLKLASLPGVISIVSPVSYAPVPFPGEEELRQVPQRPYLEELRAAKEALAKLTAGMTPDQVREKLRTDPAFKEQFEDILGQSLSFQALQPMQVPGAPGDGIEPTTIKVKDVHGASDAWAKGFRGDGVNVAIVDTGVDFGHPDLMGTWATVTGTSPYAGWPYAYDTRSGYFYAQGIANNPDNPWSRTALWYVETRPVITSTANGITATALITVDYFYRSAFTYVFSDTSKSGNYLYSIHPDVYLWAATHYLYQFWGIGQNAAGDPNAILVVDENIAGVYDTVYVDLDFDLDFRDEVPLSITNPSTNKDLDGDGVGDLSAGLLTWISDGVNPPPGMNVLFAMPPIPEQGKLIAFLGDLDSHGTNCAGDVVAQGVITDPLGMGPINPLFGGGAAGPVLAGMAPKARIVGFKDGFYFPFDSWVIATFGFDGVPGTGDEAQIVSNSWGASSIINDGWDATSRFAHWLNRNYAPNTAFLASTGNGGHGYGTVASPDGGTIIGVGASTQYGTLTNFEPITYTDQLTWGDVQPWSNRGPDTLGGLGATVVAVGAWGTGANPLNLWAYFYASPDVGNYAYDIFGGTSMASPIAAGNLAMIYQAFKSRTGRWPTYDEARTILMNGASDLGYDVLVQGAGNVNADRGADIAAGHAFMVSPPDWQAGDYRGTEHPAFPRIIHAGDSDAQTFTVSNPATTTVAITLTDAILTRYHEITFTVTISDVDPAWPTPPHWITDVTTIISNTNPDLVRAQVVFPFEQFDINGDYSYDSAWRVYFYDWTDVNGDGDLWTDANGNGLVDAGEIDEYEYNRFSFGYPRGNYLEVSLGEGKSRMHDGIFFGIQRRSGAAGDGIVTTFQVRLTFYHKQDWGWLSLDKTNLTIPGGGSDTFQATLNVPAGTSPGVYEGAIYVKDAEHTTVIPVVVNVAANSPSFSFGAASLSEPVGDQPYDNGHLFGGFDWSWRYESGDWKYFPFDVPDGTAGPGKAMIVDTRWVYEAPPPPPPPPIFYEDFEGTFPPTGWTVVDNAGTGNVWDRNDVLGGINRTNGSGFSAAADSDAVCNGLGWDTELWSEPITLTGSITFYLGYESNFQDYAGAGEAWLDISTDGGGTWTNLTYWTADRGPTYEVVNLSAYAGQTVVLRWRYSDNNDGCAWYWHIDDVALYTEMADFTPTDVDTWVYGAVADAYSTGDPAFFGPQSVEMVGGSDDTNIGAGIFTFETATGGPREVVGAEIRDGFGFIALHNVLYGGQQLAEPFVGNAYQVEASPVPVEITTTTTSDAVVMSFQSAMTITEGITATAYGLYRPLAYTDEFIAATGATNYYYVTINNGALLDVSTTSDVPTLDIDLEVYWDSDGDGVCETFIGGSYTFTADERVRVTFPGDGDYEIQVYGWSVPAGGANYDISILAAQGAEMSVSGIPTGTIAANTPVTFTVGFTHTPPTGDWEGLVFIGPASAPTALQVPHIVHFYQTVALTVTKSVNLEWADAGDVLTYTIVARNDGTYTETVSLEDPLPDYVTYDADSEWASSGTAHYDFITEKLTWSGDLAGGDVLTITFGAIVGSGSGVALNKVTVRGATSGQEVSDTARTVVNPPRIHLPLVFKNAGP